MKKILLMMLGVALMVAPASAQVAGPTAAKVDVNKLRAAITKSDAEIANAKKAVKAATWLKRGTTFLDVDAKPVNSLYVTMPVEMLKLTFGDAPAVEETIGQTAYTVYTYEHAKVYVTGGAVEFFIQTTMVDPAALEKAYEAFDKAYQLDAKTASKVGEGLATIRLKSLENGSGQYSLGNYKNASEQFRMAYRASSHPTSAAIDTLALYYAGMSATYAEDYANALNDINKALELGYESDGEAYRLKFLDLYNLDRKEESLETIKAGLARFPANENLIDMAMRYYADNEGDPTSLIPMVQEAIAKNPNNPNLYQGLARVYDKLGQIDEAIEAAHKAVELAPGDFLSNHLEGFFTLKKGDNMQAEADKQTFTSRAQAEQSETAVRGTYRRGLAPLEKAHSLNPTEPVTIELLKGLTFRLRDEEGMQAKYEKYNELFNANNPQ